MPLANPEMIATPKNTWTKVATAVQDATLHKQFVTGIAYFATYRATGTAAPTTLDDEIRWRLDSLIFSGSDPGDIYVYCKGRDGRVRVEL